MRAPLDRLPRVCYNKLIRSDKEALHVYSFLHDLLKDKKGGDIFTLFGAWHFFYIALTIALIVTVLILHKNKSADAKEKVPRLFLNLAFGFYVADFFLMPLAYGEIDIEKLPFHACTAMCVMCFLSYRIRFLKRFRAGLVLLGLLSNLVYLIYPAGVMWHAVHPLSYRVIQTLLFHALMTVYGVLVVAYEHGIFDVKKCYRDLTVILCMTLWALLGNYVYNGTSATYSHFFNWFFVVRDPFYAIPASVAPFVMPLLNVAVFFAAELLLHVLISRIKRHKTAS